MDTHYDLLGILHLVYGGLTLLIGFALMLFFNGIGVATGDPNWHTLMGLIGGVLGVVLFLLAVPHILAGVGLRSRRGWARILALVMGGLAILSFPLGTALGAYTFWALLQPDARAAFTG